jgi:hypothetical protein
MKIATVLLVLFGLLVGRPVHADEPNAQRSHWVIIATIIDRTTGQRLQRSKLGGSELEFDDLAQCKSILDRIQAVGTDRVSTVLTCRKVVRTEEYL